MKEIDVITNCCGKKREEYKKSHKKKNRLKNK